MITIIIIIIVYDLCSVQVSINDQSIRNVKTYRFKIVLQILYTVPLILRNTQNIKKNMRKIKMTDARLCPPPVERDYTFMRLTQRK